MKRLHSNAEISDCADECRGVSSLFLFSASPLFCYCETAATPEGMCDLTSTIGFNLYKYFNHGKSLNT